MCDDEFEKIFEALTGNRPFPWQAALYDRFIADRADNIPATCNLPTDLGETSVIAVWLIALARGVNIPRRFVYAVNRRTLVDQTTNEVENLRNRLREPDRYAAKSEHIPVLQSLAAELTRRCSIAPDTPLVITPRPHIVFKLVDENDDTYCHPHSRLIHIAGMVRHVAIEAMTRGARRFHWRRKTVDPQRVAKAIHKRHLTNQYH